MRREPSPLRPDFSDHAAQIGFHFAYADGKPYWDESVRYVFSLHEIESDMEQATADLGALCLELAGQIIASPARMDRLRIPRKAQPLIARSWARREPSLYGRFDFVYDGKGPPKLLEYNADTPTSLFESAVVQWYWLEHLKAARALPAPADQFNSLHEKLVERWKVLSARGPIHFACMMQSAEDAGTASYLADCAREAGFETVMTGMREIGLHRRGGVDLGFAGRDGRRIETLFKLYPWEWMFADPFGASPAMNSLRFVEPPWKMVLSNKGMLALLWEMAPGHPNLLPAFFEDDAGAASLGQFYARKPLYSREGANVTLVNGDTRSEGPDLGYGREGFIRQALHRLPEFGGHHPVLGCWLVGDAPAGLGIREDTSLITSNRSRFVPHVIVG